MRSSKILEEAPGPPQASGPAPTRVTRRPASCVLNIILVVCSSAFSALSSCHVPQFSHIKSMSAPHRMSPITSNHPQSPTNHHQKARPITSNHPLFTSAPTYHSSLETRGAVQNMSVGRSVGWPDGRSVGRSISRPVGRSIDRSVAGSVGRSIDRSVGRPVGWSTPDE